MKEICALAVTAALSLAQSGAASAASVVQGFLADPTAGPSEVNFAWPVGSGNFVGIQTFLAYQLEVTLSGRTTSAGLR